MRCSFEDVLRFLCRHKATDVTDPRLLLYQHQTAKIFGQWHQPWILLKIRTLRTVLWYFEIVTSMWLHEIVLCCDYYCVTFVIGGESSVYAIEVFTYLDGRVFRLISVKSSIGG